MKKKALIYTLTAAVLLAAALTACHKPQADQKDSEPDPAASAAVQTNTPETTTEPSAQTTPEPTAQTPEPTQTPEPAPTGTVEPQAPEETEPAASPEPEQTATPEPTQAPAPAATPAPTQKQAESKPETSNQDTTSQPGDGNGQTQTQTPPSSTPSGTWDQAFYDTLTPEQQEIYKNGNSLLRSQMKQDIEATRRQEAEGWHGDGGSSPEAIEDAWSQTHVGS